jgi:hypothetical protein
VGLRDRFGDRDEFASVALGIGAEKLEGLLLVDAVDGHEDAFGSLDDGAPSERAFEVVVFGEAPQGDVER